MSTSKRHIYVSDGQIFYHLQYGRGADGDDQVLDIGVFPSLKSARTVKARLLRKPGFRKKDGKFWISRSVVGHVGWCEGFISVAQAMREMRKG